MQNIAVKNANSVKHLLNSTSLDIIWSCLTYHSLFIVNFEQAFYAIFFSRKSFFSPNVHYALLQE